MDKELEDRFSAIGARIGALQQLEVMVKALLSAIDDIKTFSSLLKENIDSINKNQTEIAKKVNSNLKDSDQALQQHVQYTNQEFILQSKIHADFSANIHAELAKIDSRFKKLENIQQTLLAFCEKFETDFIGISAAIKCNDESLKSNAKKLESHISQFSLKQRENESQFAEIASLSAYLTTIETRLKSNIKHIQDDIDNMAINLPSKMTKSAEEMASKFDKKLSESMKGFKADIPSDLIKKIDLIQLDSQNAILKSNNSESRIQFIERKLEQALLLLKQQELNK